MDGWMDGWRRNECYRERVGTPRRGTQGCKGSEVEIYRPRTRKTTELFFGDEAGGEVFRSHISGGPDKIWNLSHR